MSQEDSGVPNAINSSPSSSSSDSPTPRPRVPEPKELSSLSSSSASHFSMDYPGPTVPEPKYLPELPNPVITGAKSLKGAQATSKRFCPATRKSGKMDAIRSLSSSSSSASHFSMDYPGPTVPEPKYYPELPNPVITGAKSLKGAQATFSPATSKSRKMDAIRSPSSSSSSSAAHFSMDYPGPTVPEPKYFPELPNPVIPGAKSLKGAQATSERSSPAKSKNGKTEDQRVPSEAQNPPDGIATEPKLEVIGKQLKRPSPLKIKGEHMTLQPRGTPGGKGSPYPSSAKRQDGKKGPKHQGGGAKNSKN